MSTHSYDPDATKSAAAEHVPTEANHIASPATKNRSKIEQPSTFTSKIVTALFYAVASFFITIVNKSILTSYRFPSFLFLSLGQMVTTVLVLFLVKKLGAISFPDFSLKIFNKIFPLQFMYIGNSVSGLGSTQNLSLPMLTVLRRISILMTMIGEYWILDIKPSWMVQISVYLMILGAVIAAARDLAFNLCGYTYVTVNNFFTAGYNIIIKQKLNLNQEIGKYGLLYYCALFMSPFCFLIVWLTGDLNKAINYDNWSNIAFLSLFALSCLMGFILIYSVMLCTQHNSALTTTIIGTLKNILVTYLGMFIGGDYVYSLENFIGINVSVLASLMYTWISFKPTNDKKKPSNSPV